MSKMSTHCVNAFQRLTWLTDGTIFATFQVFFFKRGQEHPESGDLYAVNWSSLVSGSKAEELLISTTAWVRADPRAESIELKTPPIRAERGGLPLTPWHTSKEKKSRLFENPITWPLILTRSQNRVNLPATFLGQCQDRPGHCHCQFITSTVTS